MRDGKRHRAPSLKPQAPKPQGVAISPTRIILASRSPRRSELLRAAGILFEVVFAEVDEAPRVGESPEDYVERLALEKAQAVATLEPDSYVLGADTSVVVDGRILGKPQDDAEAGAMLRSLQGRAHEVFTGVALIGPRATRSAVDRTTVWFERMTDADIRWYVESGEPKDRAGAYAIQGLASRFVSRIEGSYTNVVGLPIPMVMGLLRAELPEFRH